MEYRIWHPFTQHGQKAEMPEIVAASGSWITDKSGQRYFDAISSWWVNLHGHSHPHIAGRVNEQMKTLEHVIFSGFTHAPAQELCNRLMNHLPKNDWKFFFSDNGSTAIEVAVKMAIQYLRQQEVGTKVKVIGLEGSYHGDTFGAMSVAERSVFTTSWDDFLFEVVHIPAPLPGCENACLEALEGHADSNTVFIYEPLIQGAGGMRMYADEALQDMLSLAQSKGCILIADEVMTGFGRTGRWFASSASEIVPDIICLSKGLTGGALPMSLTVCGNHLYEAFLDERFIKGFLHGHSFTGNPVGCAAALASLDLMEEDATWEAIFMIENEIAKIAKRLTVLENVTDIRHKGTILAFEYAGVGSYDHQMREVLYEGFMHAGHLIRPLGNTVYIMPPYCTTKEELENIGTVIIEVITRIEEEQF
ncbi:MAG: adenosylmethionine--8-amino-7-oxononanoate transaminase [Flavobacteriales bacterium]|nr:adenosylmethionine--8-amino-7-oxononanoate transaminase [Flavobacteriales bacterium]